AVRRSGARRSQGEIGRGFSRGLNLPHRQIREEKRPGLLADAKVMEAGAQHGRMWLIYRPIEWKRAKTEVVDQTLHHRRPAVTLELNVANVDAGGWCPEVTIDAACLRLKRAPERETIGTKPDAAIGERCRDICEPIEMVTVPDVEPGGSAGLEAYRERCDGEPGAGSHEPRHLSNNVLCTRS